MATLVQEAILAIVTAIQTVFSTMTAADGLGPWFALGVGVSICLAIVLIIKRIVWGA